MEKHDKRKPGRPATGLVRAERLELRLTAAEKSALDQLCERHNVKSRTAMLISLITRAYFNNQ